MEKVTLRRREANKHSLFSICVLRGVCMILLSYRLSFNSIPRYREGLQPPLRTCDFEGHPSHKGPGDATQSLLTLATLILPSGIPHSWRSSVHFRARTGPARSRHHVVRQQQSYERLLDGLCGEPPAWRYSVDYSIDHNASQPAQFELQVRPAIQS